jgi:hypothetical protein
MSSAEGWTASSQEIVAIGPKGNVPSVVENSLFPVDCNLKV